MSASVHVNLLEGGMIYWQWNAHEMVIQWKEVDADWMVIKWRFNVIYDFNCDSMGIQWNTYNLDGDLIGWL